MDPVLALMGAACLLVVLAFVASAIHDFRRFDRWSEEHNRRRFDAYTNKEE